MFDDIIASAAANYNVPQSWVRAVIETESNWNPDAFNPSDPGGARGLMQITGPLAKMFGVDDVQRLFDPVVNIDLGARLLGQNRSRYGDDFRRVYSAYNSGKPDLYLTSAEVARHVERAVAALSRWADTVAEQHAGDLVGIGGLLVILAIAKLILKRGK